MMIHPSLILRRGRAALLVLGLALASTHAAAEPNAREKAAAEALFQQAVELIEQKQFGMACEKFEGSQQLDPALGTMLRLADCYDRLGRTASAWAMFQETASVARSEGQTEREQIALQRAQDLVQRLSKLELRIAPANQVEGMEVLLNGAAIPRTTWGTPLPVDPGQQRIEVSAPGRKGWAGEVNVAVGTAVEVVEVPALEEEPLLDPAANANAAAATTPEGARPKAAGSTQRTLGIIAGAVGIVGLGAGGFFGYRAYDLNQQSMEQCRRDDRNVCSERGKTLRDDAQGFGTYSTVAVAAGGALLATGVTLLITAPRSDSHASTGGSQLRVETAINGARLTWEGSF